MARGLLLLVLLSVAGWSGADTTEGQKGNRENGGKGLTMETWAAAMVTNIAPHSHSGERSESSPHIHSDPQSDRTPHQHPHSEQQSLSHPHADHSQSSQHSHEHSGTHEDTVESSNTDIEEETHSSQTRHKASKENPEDRGDANISDAKQSDFDSTHVDAETSHTKTSKATELGIDNSQIGTSNSQDTEFGSDNSQTVDPSAQNSNPTSQAHEGTSDLKSSQPAATSRLLLVSPPSDLKNQTSTRDLLTWRLKDHSLIQELTNRILASEEEEADEDADVGFGSSGVNRSQTEAASKVVERRVAAPRSSYKRHNRRPCGRQRCASVNETMELRRRLMQELESSHNAPLPARIRYRLKKKPSIYTSKKPHSRFDIGVPDIYESEVTVRAKQRRRKRPLPTQSPPDDQHPEEDYGFAADRKFQQYVLPKKPQHIPLGALSSQNYADGEEETKKPYIPLSRGPDGDQSKDLMYRPPRRPPGSNQKRRPSGFVRRPTSAPHYFTTVPQRHNIQAHLPYRRPVSFKYTRTDPTPKHAKATRPQYTTEPYPSSTPHKSTSVGYSTPAQHPPTTHKHPSTASTEGFTKPPLEYVPPSNEYIPPKAPSKTSPHPPPSKATHPPEHYVPPNKDYAAPPALHQTPKITYAPPHAPSSAPENTYVRPEIPHADPPGKYVAPEAPKNEYVAPKKPHADPPKEYVPPGNDYKPPEAVHKEPPQHYVPPNKEYIPPPQSPHAPHHESPTAEGGYTPPPSKYIPPEHEFGTNMRVPGKRRPPHRRRRPGKRRRKPHPTAPSDQYIPPNKEYAAPGTTSAAHPHPTKGRTEPPSTLYEKPKTEYVPPKTPDIHKDSIPATTVSSVSYAAPHRAYVPPLHEYQTYTPAYIPPQLYTPSPDYVPPHIPSPQTTYNTPSSAYQAPLHPYQPPVREYSPPKTTALPGWLQNIKSSHPTTQAHHTRHSNPTVPTGYYSKEPYSTLIPIYHPPEVAYSSPPSFYHSTTPAYHPPELPHAVTTPHPGYSLPSHHIRPPINEYIPPNVNLHHPSTIPPKHSTLGPPYVTPGYELSSPRPTYVPPPPPALHHPIDPNYLPPQQHYVPPINEYRPPPGYGPPPPGHAEVRYRPPTTPSGYPSSTGTPKPHYITILLPPEVTPVPAFGPPPPDYAPLKVDEFIPPSLPHESYVPPKYDYSPPASPKPNYAPPKQSYSPPTQDYVPPAKPLHTSKAEYVPPKTDYSPPASPKPDYTPPKQSYVPPTAPKIEYVPPKNEYSPPESPKPDYVPPHAIPQPDYAPPKQKYSIPTAYVPPKNDYAPPATLHPDYSPPKPSKPIIPGYVPPKSDHAPPTTAKPVYAPPHTSKPDYETPKTEYAPPKTEYTPPVTDYTPLKTVYAPPVTDYTPPKTEYTPPKTDYTPPKTEYVPPQIEYVPPKNDYEPPKPAYVPPTIDHVTPKPAYVPPKPATTAKPFIHPPHVTTYKPSLAHKLQVLQDFSYPGAGKVSPSLTRPSKRPPTTTTPYTSPVYFPSTQGPGYNDLVANARPADNYPIISQLPPPPIRPPPHFALPPDDDYYYYDDDDDYYYYDDDDYSYYDDFDYYYDDDDDDYYYYYYDYGSPRGHNSHLRRPSLPQRPHFPRPSPHLPYNIHENDILDFGYIAGIPGRAGRDYPILSYIPLTSFGCDLVADYPGYYADMEAGCQVFHICHRNGRQDSFLCPNGTVFNQKYFVCDWWYNFSCEDAPFFYPVNAAIGQPGVPLHRNAFEPDLRVVHSLPPRHLFQHPGTPTPAKFPSTGPLHHQVAIAPHIG